MDLLQFRFGQPIYQIHMVSRLVQAGRRYLFQTYIHCALLLTKQTHSFCLCLSATLNVFKNTDFTSDSEENVQSV